MSSTDTFLAIAVSLAPPIIVALGAYHDEVAALLPRRTPKPVSIPIDEEPRETTWWWIDLEELARSA